MKTGLYTQTVDPWGSLKQYTQARIAMGRCGSSVPTKELLDFKLAHAKAIDAVHIPLNTEMIVEKLRQLVSVPVYQLHSAAPTRADYLRRPDWGRKLSDSATQFLQQLPLAPTFDVALVVADGLSSHAVEKNIESMFRLLIPALNQAGYSIAPVTVVGQGRVAVADEIGFLLRASLTVIFIGERPGLKTPDSLGVYLTYAPEPGTTDERRNCISNVRTDGLICSLACSKLMYLINEAMHRKLSGVDLKDEQDNLPDYHNSSTCASQIEQ